MSPLDPKDVQALYAEPLDRFMDARRELVAGLRAAGDREAGTEAGRLRKPSVAAWTVNQLARRQPRDVAALFDANDQLRSVQSGRRGGRDAFRDAVAARQRVLARLDDSARELLEESGSNASRVTLDRVVATFLATASDPGLAEAVRRGVVDAPPPPGPDRTPSPGTSRPRGPA